jgi:hypothetical protein
VEEKTILKVVREPSFDLTILVEDPVSGAETYWDLTKDMEKLIEGMLKKRARKDSNVARAYALLQSGQKYR